MRCHILDQKSTAPSSGVFHRRRSTCDLLITAVSARPVYRPEENFGAHQRRWAVPAAELLQKTNVIWLNKNHSESSSKYGISLRDDIFKSFKIPIAQY